MITVTITPYVTSEKALKKIQVRYPDAIINHVAKREPGRFALELPSKNASNWTEQDDTAFFNQLADDDVLIGWAILGGVNGRDFQGR